MLENNNNKNYFSLFRNLLLPFLVIAIIFLLLFYKILISDGFIISGDNSFLFNKAYISAWSPYQGNGTVISAGVFLYGYEVVLVRFFNLLKLSNDVSSKIIFLLPIYITFILTYYLLKKVSKSIFFSLFGTILFIFSTICMEYTFISLVTYFFHIISVELLLLIILSIEKSRSLNWKHILLIALTSLLNFHPFFLIIYLLFLSIYLIYYINSYFDRKIILKLSSVFLLIFLLNLYWILPFLMSVFFGNSNPEAVYGESNLNSVLMGFIAHSKIYRMIVGSVYPISYLWGNTTNFFVIISSFLLFSMFIFTLIQSFRKKNRFAIFLSIATFIFFGISFWPNNPLLRFLWDFLYSRFSFFGFFRSFNRFSTILLPLILCLLAVYYRELVNRKIFNFLLIFVVLTAVFGKLFLFTGDYGGMIPVFSIPNEYDELKVYIQKKNSHDARILSYPKTDYESYSWNKNRNYEKYPQVYTFIEFYLDGVTLHNRYGNHIFRSNNFYKKLFDPWNLKTENEILNNLSKLNIDYILIQKDLVNRKGMNVSYSYAQKYFDTSSFNKIFNNEYFELYEVSYPTIYDKNYKIKEIYPFYYSVEFDFSNNKTSELIFPQNFDRGWKIFYSKRESLGFIEKNAIPFFNREIKIENNDNKPGNKWILNREDFNDDKIEIYLYYYPQIYVFIGSAVALITLTSLSLVGVFFLLRKVRNRKLTKYV